MKEENSILSSELSHGVSTVQIQTFPESTRESPRQSNGLKVIWKENDYLLLEVNLGEVDLEGGVDLCY